MAHTIVNDPKAHYGYMRARCTTCLRYAMTEEMLAGLYPDCTEPKLEPTRLDSVFYAIYSDRQNKRELFWHQKCNQFLLGSSGVEYTCGCAEQISFKKSPEAAPPININVDFMSPLMRPVKLADVLRRFGQIRCLLMGRQKSA